MNEAKKQSNFILFLKSLRAILTGFIIIAALSFGTDYAMGLLQRGNINIAFQYIVFVIFYRTFYNVIGCYFIAKLSPNYPVRHALFAGLIGFIISIVETIVLWNKNVGPVWYSLSVGLLCLPSAWFGAELFLLRESRPKKE